MRYLRRRMRSRRFLLVSAVVTVAVLGGTAAIAYAGYPTDSVSVMSGCLTISGTGSGNIVNVAMGTNPAKTCGANQTTVHLSGGTITQVTGGIGLTTSGSGGTNSGGSANSINNGWVKLGLLPGFTLPQGCTSGQVPDWGGVSGTWTCGNDQNTTYSAGAGLDLSNANVFSINSAYQLPQGCTNGQIPGWAGQTWGCANDQNTTYSGKDFAISNQNCPPGKFATGVDGNGNLKCAQPTVDDLKGSPCTFSGHSSTLDVSTDNTTGDVRLKCNPVYEVSASQTGVGTPQFQIIDDTHGNLDTFCASTCSVLVPAGDQVRIFLSSGNPAGGGGTPFTYTCTGQGSQSAGSQQRGNGPIYFAGCPDSLGDFTTITSDYAMTATGSS